MLSVIDYFRNIFGCPYEYQSPKVVIVGGGVGGVTVSNQLKKNGIRYSYFLSNEIQFSFPFPHLLLISHRNR